MALTLPPGDPKSAVPSPLVHVHPGRAAPAVHDADRPVPLGRGAGRPVAPVRTAVQTVPAALAVRAAGPPGPGPHTDRRPRELPSAHMAVICVALPSMAVSPDHGQLTGQGLDGFYRSGRRLLSRCHLRVAGREPIAVQGALVTSDSARFLGVVRTAADAGPDPEITVERMRRAEGTERITLHSASARTRRFPVEISLATDLAELGAIATGRPGPERIPSVYGSGLRWTAADGPGCTVAADPPPQDAVASAGLLRWDVLLAPGASYGIELSIRPERRGRTPGRPANRLSADVRAEADDARVEPLVRTALGDLRALLVSGEQGPADGWLAAGVPWRCGPAPAEALWAARMALPLGTGLAAATLRTLARTQLTGPGTGHGRIPGPLRDAGPRLPPSCTGVEATLAYPVVLAEARRWGLSEQEVAELLPAAERCLRWLRTSSEEDGLVPDGGPDGYRRAETQAHAHRAALLGAELLDECGGGGGDAWREWAGALRSRFRADFWIDDRAGGCPAAARSGPGRPVAYPGSGAAHLLDTGLLGGGRLAPGLLDAERTGRLARLLGGPALDSGWGLRTLGAKEPGHNPFGHRSGAVRVHETAVACAGLAAAGYEKEASGLLRGVLGAAEAFGYRLPEMYAGEQRRAGSVPAPHPTACRPAAVAAAAGVHLVTTLAGIRPDAPAATVSLRPVRCAPLGAVQLSGLRVAGEPFAVRISRLGLGMIEEAAAGLQLGV